MGAGNCYPAAWNAINTKKNDDYIVVHALRDIFKGANHFGGHAFLVRKWKDGKLLKNPTVYDDSISAKYIEGSVDGVVDGMPFDEYVEKTFVVTEGDYVYREYTRIELNKETMKDMAHMPFDLAKEQWSMKPKEFSKRFPGYDSYVDYMKNYFQPTFEPHWVKLMEMNKANEAKKKKV
jgi:hypothetical protein|tara:strand:- start:406 stop:939 length:534 start_codon:yes stop_codon:yes gene_type:complete